jgi:MoaD family protein
MKKIKIKLLKPFSDAVGKSELEVDFNGSTLEDLLKVLVDRYPKLKKEFYTETDELTEYICVFVNDKPISALNGINTDLKNDDELLFFIPISGG